MQHARVIDVTNWYQGWTYKSSCWPPLRSLEDHLLGCATETIQTAFTMAMPDIFCFTIISFEHAFTSGTGSVYTPVIFALCLFVWNDDSIPQGSLHCAFSSGVIVVYRGDLYAVPFRAE